MSEQLKNHHFKAALLLLPLLCCLVFSNSSSASEVPKLTLLTEEWRPFNFQEGEDIKGLCSELVFAALDKAGYSYQKSLLPWQRAFKETLKKPNTLLYTTSRTQQRENQFKWIGPLIIQDVSFYKLKDDKPLNVTSVEQLKNFRIGVSQGGSVHGYLLQNSFVEGDDFITYIDEIQGIKMLESDRVDLIPGSKFTVKYQEKFLADNKLEKVYTLLVAEYYIAANLNTSDNIISKIQSALDELVKSGRREEITQRYLSKDMTSANDN